jgi:hypothetical protein
MRWFRSIRRFGAGLGLFALLIQFAVSFGHVHPHDLLPRSPAGAVDQVAGKATPPAGQDRRVPGAPHDDCPVCSVMHLAGTIVMPSAPSLPLPTQFTVTSFAAAEFNYVPIHRRLPFQTRAPPVA